MPFLFGILAASIFRQVVEGVLYLHRSKTNRDGTVVGNPILHRDLKPSNVCFAKDNSVVSNFLFGLFWQVDWGVWILYLRPRFSILEGNYF